MRKVDDGENGENPEKIMTFIVATNVVAPRPPKRRATGTPNARANNAFLHNMIINAVFVSQIIGGFFF